MEESLVIGFHEKKYLRIKETHTDWFDIIRNFRQGCVASHWQFNLPLANCITDFNDSVNVSENQECSEKRALRTERRYSDKK